MIDLSRVRTVLGEVTDLVEKLDGVDHDDASAVTNQSKGDARRERANRSQELQLLASRFELAAALTRIEYWHARGESDPLDPERSQPAPDAD